MPFRYSVLFPVFFLVLILGCGGKGTQPSKYEANFNGISIEVYGFGEHRTQIVTEDHVVVTNGSNRLELKNDRVVANGKDYGPVKKGDKVVLGADGQVTLNNSSRPSSD